jgi:1,4-dihydroxy-2-naphthoate octaprenyltransferase
VIAPEAHDASPHVARAAGRSAGAYARLVKLSAFDHYLSIPLCWTLLALPQAMRARTGWELALALVTIAGCVWATVALDDIQGSRDGTDLANLEKANGVERRDVANKPLISGALTVAEVRRFAIACVLCGVGSLVALYVIVGGRPHWFFPLAAGLFAVALQYSSGLRVSYRGGQETVLAVTAAAAVFCPFVLITGHVTARAGIESLLVGIWMLQVSAFSNTFDRDGDRRSGRSTVAATLETEANNRFIVAVFCAGWLTVAGGIASGALPALLAVVFIPVLATQARQLMTGVGRGQLLHARRLGFTAFRMGVAALVAVNLIYWPR